MRSSVDDDLIRMLAAFADLEIPEDDLELVVAYLTNVLDGGDQLGGLELTAVEPIVTLDPRWE
jgi:Asp-tRNA(Asn)/Glu-tRNA(Gln) amidotransferase C subunit